MTRLPQPGSDDGSWGSILNDFLAVEHATDGSLKLRTDGSLTKAMVGLANVDNTSDAGKPVSAATQTALDAKAGDSTVVHLSGAETITGNKTYTGASQITISDTTTQALRIDLPGGDRTGTSAPDTLAIYYNGGRTGYFNEYGELRIIASAINRTPLRVKQANGGSQSANLIEATDISNVALFSVGPTGNVAAPNLTVSSWQTMQSFNTDASSNGTYATVGVRKEPLYGLGRLRGGVSVGGDGILSSEALVTLPSGYRPIATFSCGVRVSGSNVARQITVNTDGTIQVASALVAGDTVLLDGMVFPIS